MKVPLERKGDGPRRDIIYVGDVTDGSTGSNFQKAGVGVFDISQGWAQPHGSHGPHAANLNGD